MCKAVIGGRGATVSELLGLESNELNVILIAE
jgi:hypothetical protein